MVLRRALAVVLVVGTAVTACTASRQPDGPASRPPIASPAPSGPSTYVALGDSVAAGVGAPPSQGYVPLLAARLSAELGCDDGAPSGCPVQVRNLAVSGATTTTLLRDQLPAALDLLRTAPDVRLVTVTIGGNDVVQPVLRACARAPQDAGCSAAVAAAVQGADAGIDRVLVALADAAGPATTVAVMTYYDPVPACRLAALQPLAERVLEGTADAPGLNDVLRARAEQHGVLVVETGDRLTAPGDFVGGRDCLHPSGTGHARIAEAFGDVVASAVVGG